MKKIFVIIHNDDSSKICRLFLGIRDLETDTQGCTISDTTVSHIGFFADKHGLVNGSQHRIIILHFRSGHLHVIFHSGHVLSLTHIHSADSLRFQHGVFDLLRIIRNLDGSSGGVDLNLEVTTVSVAQTILFNYKKPIFIHDFYRALKGPVVHVIQFVTFSVEQFLKHFSQVAVIGLIFELQGSAVVEVSGEFNGQALAQDFNGSGHLLLHNLVVLFLLVVGLNTLPRQKSSHQINQHITNSLQIISSTLFYRLKLISKKLKLSSIPIPRCALMEA